MDKKIDINLLRLALKRSYCKETAYPGAWKENNPSIGQCAVAAMVAYDFLGGEIAKVDLPNLQFSHYFNLIGDKVYDFTNLQFSQNYIDKYNIYKGYTIKRKKDISGTVNTRERYKLLKKRVNEFITSFFSLQKRIEKCEKCSFVEHLKGPIIKVGKETDHLFIGEAPAPNGWRKSGKAFYTPEGKLLATGKNLLKMLEVLKIELENITYTEIVKCMPDKRRFLKRAVKNCKPFLLEQLGLIKPKIIIPLGSYASIYLTEILGLRNSRPFKELKGRVLKSEGILVLPLQHPSPANPYGLKFNIPVLRELISLKDYQERIIPDIYIDDLNL